MCSTVLEKKMSGISLNASMRTNLLSLQNTQSLMDQTQERLSTGLKVNSAIDSPSSYYTAQSLNNRASDLSALLDSMGQGVQTIKAANEGIESITTFVEQAKAVANSARDEANKVVAKTVEGDNVAGTTAEKAKALKATAEGKAKVNINGTATEIDYAQNDTLESVIEKINGALGSKGSAAIVAGDTAADYKIALTADTLESVKVEFGAGFGTVKAPAEAVTATEDFSTRTKYSEQFNKILTQIDQLAKDSGYKGINLLQNNDLTVIFNEDRSSSIVVKGADASSSGLKINAAGNSWKDDADINTSISEIETAVSTLRTMASDFGNYYSIVETRQDFTKNLINVLTEGADNLTLADMNEESANMLALQTRQQLAINSLSLASQAAQSVLSLF